MIGPVLEPRVAAQGSCPQDLLAPQRPLQPRLYLHVLELPDGEVEVLQGLGAFVGVVVQKQLRELEPCDGYLGTGTIANL